MDEREYAEYQQKVAAKQTTSDDEYAGTVREERVRTLLSEIDPDNLVESIEYRIRGYKFNKRRGQWEKVQSDSCDVSELLVSKTISLIASVLNNNTTFSNLQSSDINRIMGLLIDIVISDMVVNGKKYGIHDDFNEKERICFIIFGTVNFALRRAINGTEARRFFGSLRMNEQISPDKKGGWGGIKDAAQIWN